jgi:hypothetical protein
MWVAGIRAQQLFIKRYDPCSRFAGLKFAFGKFRSSVNPEKIDIENRRYDEEKSLTCFARNLVYFRLWY